MTKEDEATGALAALSLNKNKGTKSEKLAIENRER